MAHLLPATTSGSKIIFSKVLFFNKNTVLEQLESAEEPGCSAQGSTLHDPGPSAWLWVFFFYNFLLNNIVLLHISALMFLRES